MRDVVVIGAGVAGLTAASTLSEAGLDVVVVEARDRIGGRTHTVDVGGGTVDLGGAWVHDPGHNPLMPLLESLGLEVMPDAMWGRGMRVFERDGWLSTAATSTLLASLYNFDPSDVPGVMSDRYTDGIDRFVDIHVPAGLRHAVRSYLGQFAGAGIAGDHPRDISLSGLAAYEGEESGHNSVLVGGYRSLVDRLADGVEVVLGSPVTDIRHNASEVAVSGPGLDIGARWAIVTVPLGVLRSGSPTFEPDLPASHRDAISTARVQAAREGRVHVRRAVLGRRSRRDRSAR